MQYTTGFTALCTTALRKLTQQREGEIRGRDEDEEVLAVCVCVCVGDVTGTGMYSGDTSVCSFWETASFAQTSGKSVS